jgi:hypothetical protein
MTGMRAYPQHSHSDSQAASGDPAWSELEDSMQSMHEALFSLKSTGNRSPSWKEQDDDSRRNHSVDTSFWKEKQ